MSGQSSGPEEAAEGMTEHRTKRDRGKAPRERALRSDARSSRKMLLVAARELFAERGPDGLTIVEVAKRAGLNRSTAYQHFCNREELTQAVAEQFAAELRELLREPRGMAEQIDFFVHYFHEHPEIARLWMFHLLTGKSRLREGWGDYTESLERMAESRQSVPGIDAEMLGVIGLVSALAWSVMVGQHTGGDEAALAETDRFASELKRLVLAGTRKPE
ncbi:MAG: TetR/AcrR family transcriptional regulator [bacterium]|nr:TetR/AcrR family transcriptional regulator [bacterium]